MLHGRVFRPQSYSGRSADFVLNIEQSLQYDVNICSIDSIILCILKPDLHNIVMILNILYKVAKSARIRLRTKNLNACGCSIQQQWNRDQEIRVRIKYRLFITIRVCGR